MSEWRKIMERLGELEADRLRLEFGDKPRLVGITEVTEGTERPSGCYRCEEKDRRIAVLEGKLATVASLMNSIKE